MKTAPFSWFMVRKSYHTKVSTIMRDPFLFNV